MFKKIKDERIQLKNLRHIRILFMIQSLGILTILIYDLVTGGFEKMMSNPLWYVFMITLIVSGYLSMNISVNYEPENKSPKRSLMIGFLVVIGISIIISITVALVESGDWKSGFLVGGIIFICSIIPMFYLYHLRRRQL
ncbi:MAG TPA: hypothetical protein VK061_01170 [Bacillota bacterium]|nr:hypothetical protein [Bacillota bacterium]